MTKEAITIKHKTKYGGREFDYGPLLNVHTHIGSHLDKIFSSQSRNSKEILCGKLVIKRDSQFTENDKLDGRNNGVDYSVDVVSPANLKGLGLYLLTYAKTASKQIKRLIAKKT